MDDFRLYVNPQPGKNARWTAEWQRAPMPEGEVYTETKAGRMIDVLIRSIRPDYGSVVVVRRLFCLAPWTGTPTQRKREMARRVDRIKAAGGVVMEAETGRRSDEGVCAQMVADGIADIASAGRANAKGKRGNPIELTPDQLKTAELVWRSREYKNDAARLVAIEAAIGRKLKRAWCWQKFGSPSGRPAEPQE